jgi:mannose/cellobiose epimerase-like protein (N-acyl-D-glucosamine 2-epimerase family)
MLRQSLRFVSLAFTCACLCCSKQNGPSKSSDGGTSEHPKPPPAPEPTSLLSYPPERWVTHLVDELMPFWMQKEAIPEPYDSPYPTYRCNDGKVFGEKYCDLKSGQYRQMADSNEMVRKRFNKDGPYEWITGPKNELLNRTYIRMHSRQTYVYGIAYHLTGESRYLALAHRGVTWLLKHAIDKENGSYTFIENNKPQPQPEYRTSQDQSYTLLGLAFYYYLTRDPEVLAVLTDLKNKVVSRYMSKDWEGGKLVRWMLKSNLEPKPTCTSTIAAPDKGSVEQKELVALLDQVNAYMLLVTTAVPKNALGAWLPELYSMAGTIKERFYNDGIKSKDQKTTGVSPVVHKGLFAGCLTYTKLPEAAVDPEVAELPCNPKKLPPIDKENCDPANHHTDFGHSIKSLWMLYLIGREQGDAQMMDFARKGAEEVFNFAYLNDGTWGRAFTATVESPGADPTFTVDRNKEWWIYAELDQMSGTMALLDAPSHVKRLNTTYKYWLGDFGAPPEVVQWKYDSFAYDTPAYNMGIPKANLWKNGFHSTEHALVAYITTSGVEKKPATLYYALVGQGEPKLQPYYYLATVKTDAPEPFTADSVNYRKIKATFTNIKAAN